MRGVQEPQRGSIFGGVLEVSGRLVCLCFGLLGRFWCILEKSLHDYIVQRLGVFQVIAVIQHSKMAWNRP